MRGRQFMVALASMSGLLIAQPAFAQVTFRSIEVLGITGETRASGQNLRPTYHEDERIAFFSEDGRHYVLEGFGCRFELQPLREAYSPEDAKVTGAVLTDVESYQNAVKEGAPDFTAVSVGELTRLGPGREGDEAYGLACREDLVTAVSLDVMRVRGVRRLRILVLQTRDGNAAAASNALAVATMENIIFKPRTEDELAKASPLTAGIYRALTR